MTPQQFASCIRLEILNQNLAVYQAMFREENLSVHKDQFYKQMTVFYTSLNEEQRRQFEIAVRQIMADTISNILGILDGTTILEKYREEFRLVYGNGKNQLNGNLQDYFLAAEQANSAR